jgi:hypothetical protein
VRAQAKDHSAHKPFFCDGHHIFRLSIGAWWADWGAAMKAIALTIVFFAIITASVMTFGAAAKPRSAAAQAEQSLDRQTPHPTAIDQSQQVLHFPTIDRSRKGDRLDSAKAEIRVELPPGCESPFSPLAQLPRPNLIARCMT